MADLNLSTEPLFPKRSDVPDAVRAQILATEHWSLLATRGMTWNEMFSRAGMYLTVLSAAVVALALVAQATAFGANFQLFALVLLPVVLLLGWETQIRLGDARGEDIWMVAGMNRLRHAYLELAPDLEPYFITAHYDDMAGIKLTYSPHTCFRPSRILAGTPVLVGIINAVVAGVLGALVVDTLGGASRVYIGAGLVVGLAYMAAFATIPFRQMARIRREYQPRFPHGTDPRPA